MTKIEKRKKVREILLIPKFLRLKQISMAIDYRLDKDRKEDRYSHSIEVANCCEIMNDSISEKLGVEIDYKNVSYIVGLLHDIGHTAFGHEGEKTLGKYSQFDGNANNYIVIEKNNILNNIKKEDRDYILASLAKHPGQLYKEQKHIKNIVQKEVKKEIEWFKRIGINMSEMKKTMQCQIMDIADENCYVVSDIIDAQNIFSNKYFAKIFRKELPEEKAEEIISALYKGKKDFVDKMQEIFFLFSENFTVENGIVVPENKDIEKIRRAFMHINKKYVIGSEVIKKIRKNNEVILNTVFSYYFNNEKAVIPSKFYRNEITRSSSKEEKNILIRDMLGQLTDKGIKKLYYKIKRTENGS
jgi:dGTP triphosphohydrolase